MNDLNSVLIEGDIVRFPEYWDSASKSWAVSNPAVFTIAGTCDDAIMEFEIRTTMFTTRMAKELAVGDHLRIRGRLQQRRDALVAETYVLAEQIEREEVST